MQGKTPSEDTKTRLSKANGTSFEVLDLKNNITTTFDSIRQAAKPLNISILLYKNILNYKCLIKIDMFLQLQK
jgi:hypothetical protein